MGLAFILLPAASFQQCLNFSGEGKVYTVYRLDELLTIGGLASRTACQNRS